jgi:cytoskeleton protein RodZ
MTPFASTTPSVDTSTVADGTAVPAGQHTLKITLAEPSWVEIAAADGQKLEFGLLTAGTTRIYHSAQTIDARLGNVTGASVEVDGKAQDLTPFRHANVAHFKLSSGDTTISHSGG